MKVQGETLNIQDTVFSIIGKRPHINTSRALIMDETGYTEKQVMAAVSRVQRNLNADYEPTGVIHTVKQGLVWRWLPQSQETTSQGDSKRRRTFESHNDNVNRVTSSTRRLYEEIAREGRVLVLRDDVGEILVADIRS